MAKQIESRIIESKQYPWRDFGFLQNAEFKDISQEAFQKIKESIKNNNFVESFKAWKNGKKVYCLDGYHRCKALKELEQEGYEVPEEMPTDFLKCSSKNDAAKLVTIYSSIYAKTTGEGLYQFLKDYDLNFDELQSEIDIPNIDLDAFSEDYYEDDSFTDEEADYIPEDVEPTAKLGDLYLLGGKHRLFCGDCTVKENVEYLMNGEKADMVFTDPPYNIASDSKNHAADTSKAMNDLKNSEWDKNFDIVPALDSIMTVCANSVTIYVWTSQFLIQKIWDHLGQWCDFTSYCVWAKPNPIPSLSKRHWTWNSELCVYATRGTKRTVNFPEDGHAPSVWQFTKKSDGTHPTQKPVELCEHPINFSSAKSSIVFDAFAGSGSTLIACEQTDRICYGMEIDPHYCDVIIQRYKDLTGKEVELIDNIHQEKASA